MSYKEFFNKMKEGKLVSDSWHTILDLLYLEYKCNEIDEYLEILTLHFSLIDDGNVYMPINKDMLYEKFSSKISGEKIQSAEDDEERNAFYDSLLKDINAVIDKVEKIKSFTEIICSDGTEKMFVVFDDRLYTRKNYNAAQSILRSVKRLFNNNAMNVSAFNYKNYVKAGYQLTKGQEEILTKGYNKNLYITGGPGVGKTTSIFFLLLSLLSNNNDCNVYLTAPSGKAASRMKDSILSSITQINNFPNTAILDKINNLNEYTIHRLLGYSPQENSFTYNAKNQFKDNSIFVIDEASMIDVSMFALLLEAIPDSARVFILGDKDQLPSVECGAVFGALLDDSFLMNNIVFLDESKRFSETSDIYKLARAINTGSDLSYIETSWVESSKFEVFENSNEVAQTPIYFYADSEKKETEIIENIANKWYKAFYESKNFQDSCKGIIIDEEQKHLESLNNLWNVGENARILCASNKSARGVNSFNKIILKKFYSHKQKISGFYPGELLIVTQNNKQLDLYNGDCGITVTFDGDDTLYLMLKKSSNLKIDNKKVDNKIFMLGKEFLFYPIRLISTETISPAFAISIHKSQGSDYENILVVLPKMKGHPLLNRQIVYTAITRTRKNTYILSSQANLQHASNTIIKRDTF